jgi:hypothetical protein
MSSVKETNFEAIGQLCAVNGYINLKPIVQDLECTPMNFYIHGCRGRHHGEHCENGWSMSPQRLFCYHYDAAEIVYQTKASDVFADLDAKTFICNKYALPMDVSFADFESKWIEYSQIEYNKFKEISDMHIEHNKKFGCHFDGYRQFHAINCTLEGKHVEVNEPPLEFPS